MSVKLNKEVCHEHLETLETANEQWFYGYHYSTEDYLKLVEAVKFFEDIKVQQRKKLIKEGLL
jgi:hypothetical protein